MGWVGATARNPAHGGQSMFGYGLRPGPTYGRDVMAERARHFPPVGGCRRHLLAIGHRPRLSGGQPPGRRRRDAYPLAIHDAHARRAVRA
jgi:hypothetical protein